MDLRGVQQRNEALMLERCNICQQRHIPGSARQKSCQAIGQTYSRMDSELSKSITSSPRLSGDPKSRVSASTAGMKRSFNDVHAFPVSKCFSELSSLIRKGSYASDNTTKDVHHDLDEQIVKKFSTDLEFSTTGREVLQHKFMSAIQDTDPAFYPTEHDLENVSSIITRLNDSADSIDRVIQRHSDPEKLERSRDYSASIRAIAERLEGWTYEEQ